MTWFKRCKGHIIQDYLIKQWYKKNSVFSGLLLPIACVYGWIIRVRRDYLEHHASWRAPVPVLIVGNITVGGVGKTPLVAAIAHHYVRQGWRVGIVSRGYGANIKGLPHEISVHDTAQSVGDEPLLLALLTGCPVVIASRRVEAVRALLKRYPLDLIISDDGLQHYALGRQVEIAVVDGHRGLGNGRLLPAGPLRETAERLSEVDMVVVNGPMHKSVEKLEIKYSMHLQPVEFKALSTGAKLALDTFKDRAVSAVTGIGHPALFFDLLNRLGLNVVSQHAFPDHHAFNAQDFEKIAGCVIMTEKDAVKCKPFAKDSWYSLSVEARLEDPFWDALSVKIKQKK